MRAFTTVKIVQAYLRLAFLTLALGVVAPQSSQAEDTLMWMDDGGNIFFADSIQNIPPQYRDQYLKKPAGPSTMDEYKKELADFKQKQKTEAKEKKKAEKAQQKLEKEKLKLAAKEQKRLLKEQKKRERK